MILFFDTETSGKAIFKLPPEDPLQPRLVQLGMLLTGEGVDIKNPAARISILVESAGSKFDVEAKEVHGISEQAADEGGVTMPQALGIFRSIVAKASLVVAHNYPFDSLIMAAQFHAFEAKNPLESVVSYCTMAAATNVCKLKHKGRGWRGRDPYKWPQLQEAHEFFFGERFEGAHDALADVEACAAVYKALRDRVPT